VKIDAYRSDISAAAADRVGKPANWVGNRDEKDQSTKPAATPATGDEVRISSEAMMMQSVMQGAHDALNVRWEVVERMRAAVSKGQVGNDPHALADAILDRLSGTSQEKQR
jgi:flagellar biosynthesis anti-sigma factor FlgM